MKIHFRTVLVSTAALAITGGAAFAYINATSVSGTGSATTAQVSTNLSLSVDAKNVTAIPGPVTIDVMGKVLNGPALRAPSTVNVAVTTTPAPPACPGGSFTATYAPKPGGAVTVPAGGSAVVVGTITVSFNEVDAEQSGCNGAALAFTFS